MRSALPDPLRGKVHRGMMSRLVQLLGGLLRYSNLVKQGNLCKTD